MWMVNEDYYVIMLKMIVVREKMVVDIIFESEMVKNFINIFMLNIVCYKNMLLLILRKFVVVFFNEDVRIVDVLIRNVIFREVGLFELMIIKFVMECRRVVSDFCFS